MFFSSFAVSWAPTNQQGTTGQASTRLARALSWWPIQDPVKTSPAWTWWGDSSTPQSQKAPPGWLQSFWALHTVPMKAPHPSTAVLRGHGETTLHSSAQTRGWIKTWKFQIFKGDHSPLVFFSQFLRDVFPEGCHLHGWPSEHQKTEKPTLLRLTTSAKVVFSLGLTSQVSAGDLAKTGAKLVGKWGKWLLNEPLGYENGCRFIFYIFFVGWFFVFQWFSLGHVSLLFAAFWSKNLYFAEFWS